METEDRRFREMLWLSVLTPPYLTSPLYPVQVLSLLPTVRGVGIVGLVEVAEEAAG